MHSNQRDTIEKVKEIFLYIFGAKEFKYWNNDVEDRNMPVDVKSLASNEKKEFLLLKEENRFCIKVRWNDRFFWNH